MIYFRLLAEAPCDTQVGRSFGFPPYEKYNPTYMMEISNVVLSVMEMTMVLHTVIFGVYLHKDKRFLSGAIRKMNHEIELLLAQSLISRYRPGGLAKLFFMQQIWLSNLAIQKRKSS